MHEASLSYEFALSDLYNIQGSLQACPCTSIERTERQLQENVHTYTEALKGACVRDRISICSSARRVRLEINRYSSSCSGKKSFLFTTSFKEPMRKILLAAFRSRDPCGPHIMLENSSSKQIKTHLIDTCAALVRQFETAG